MPDVHLFTPLFRRRSVPLPTWRAGVILIMILAVLLWLVPHRLFRVLAVTRPQGTGVLVIEGWVPDRAVLAGVAVYKKGSYTHIVTTGVPLDLGSLLAPYATTADVARATCVHLGVDSGQVSSAPVHGHVIRDRTLASAYALRSWLRQWSPGTRSIDIVTQGVHARRTWMIFSHVLGDSVQVGIIAARETEYNENDWWKTSAGFKDVMGEMIGIVYAAVMPDQSPDEESP